MPKDFVPPPPPPPPPPGTDPNSPEVVKFREEQAAYIKDVESSLNNLDGIDPKDKESVKRKLEALKKISKEQKQAAIEKKIKKGKTTKEIENKKSEIREFLK